LLCLLSRSYGNFPPHVLASLTNSLGTGAFLFFKELGADEISFPLSTPSGLLGGKIVALLQKFEKNLKKTAFYRKIH
jgi:hypothetical protein